MSFILHHGIINRSARRKIGNDGIEGDFGGKGKQRKAYGATQPIASNETFYSHNSLETNHTSSSFQLDGYWLG
jgi:hypothetical protein